MLPVIAGAALWAWRLRYLIGAGAAVAHVKTDGASTKAALNGVDTVASVGGAVIGKDNAQAVAGVAGKTAVAVGEGLGGMLVTAGAHYGKKAIDMIPPGKIGATARVLVAGSQDKLDGLKDGTAAQIAKLKGDKDVVADGDIKKAGVNTSEAFKATAENTEEAAKQKLTGFTAEGFKEGLKAKMHSLRSEFAMAAEQTGAIMKEEPNPFMKLMAMFMFFKFMMKAMGGLDDDAPKARPSNLPQADRQLAPAPSLG